MNADQAKALRDEFPANLVGRLPKAGITLDYVGHGAVTDRLLQVDPEWTWEPFALDERGLPALDEDGNLWIKLTVCGVTRVGVGDGPTMKILIGDAIRNAAMRFGVALDLWIKGHAEDDDRNNTGPRTRPSPASSASNEKRDLVQQLERLNLPTNGDLPTLRQRLADAKARPVAEGDTRPFTSEDDDPKLSGGWCKTCGHSEGVHRDDGACSGQQLVGPGNEHDGGDFVPCKCSAYVARDDLAGRASAMREKVGAGKGVDHATRAAGGDA